MRHSRSQSSTPEPFRQSKDQFIPCKTAQKTKVETDSAHTSNPFIQAKLIIGGSNDRFEQEADHMAEKVTQRTSDEPSVQKKCSKCEEESVQKMDSSSQSSSSVANSGLETQLKETKGSGSQMDASTKNEMETGFGEDFSRVNIHTNDAAVQMNRELGAKAFTHGNDIYFNKSEYNPSSTGGKKLLAHELTHTVQQNGSTPLIQRTIGDGHDLTSPRFSNLTDLEATFDNEIRLELGDSGRGVLAVQMALYDLGFSLPVHGSNGEFNQETEDAVKAYQRANSPLREDGIVGFRTIGSLDARFGTPTLPAPADLGGPWTEACVQNVLCPWSPHTINVMRDRIRLKSFDRVFWEDEAWNGTDWEIRIFEGGGYNTGTEIGIVNTSCENISETIYHEVLHAEQPSSQTTTLERESYAYRIGEEFSIAMGLGGRSSLRSTDAQGREFADTTKVNDFVSDAYPSVPSGGGGGQIIGKGHVHGEVRVRQPDGSIITRPANVDETVPGPKRIVNEVDHDTSTWNCP